MKKLLILILSIVWITAAAQPQYDGALARFKMKSDEAVREGLVGEYYQGNDFRKLVAVRQDKQIYFDWNYQPPIKELNAEYFSIRWRGKVYAQKPGKYILTAMTDDGMRVWINGRIVLNAWVDQPPMVYEKRLILEGDAFYDIRVDYYQKQYQTTAAVFLNHIDDERMPLSDLNTVFGRGLAPSESKFDFWEEEDLLDRFYTWLGFQEEEEIEIIDKSFRPLAEKRMEQEISQAEVIYAKELTEIFPEVSEKEIDNTVQEASINLSSDKTEENPYEELKQGDTLVMQNIYFDQGKSQLRPESYGELELLYNALKHHPEWRIKIDGHTDNVGYAALNLELSFDRARAVYFYLIGEGIDKSRLTFEGFGSSQPIAKNDSEINKQLNRRVEVTLQDESLTTRN